MGAATQSSTSMMDSNSNDDGNSDSIDSEEEDDLADIPDTREYMPINVEGLQSIGIGRGSSEHFDKEGSDGYTMEDVQNMKMNNPELLDDDDEEDEDDQNDIQLNDRDALVVVAKTEEDFASLEVNVFDTHSSNLYVHHDIPLPAYPLCFALGNVVAGYDGCEATMGNYVAVGSFDPGIEIWNLDVMNALEPTVVLGGVDTSEAEERWMRLPGATASGKKGKKRSNGPLPQSDSNLREGSHTSAVMGLSWNAIHTQVLASGSADGTVKVN